MSVANLKVSACRRFAVLYNSTGEYFLVWSKPQARYMVESGIKHSVITSEDAETLLSQIEASPMPEADELVTPEVMTALRNLNEAHAELVGYELEEEMITQVIDFIEGAHKPTKH